MVSIEEMRFRYRGNLAFNYLNWRVEDGTVLGLLGKNGAGKSTLLRLVSGILCEDSGILRVDGLRPFNRQDEFLDNIFYLPEDSPPEHLTAVQFASHYGRFYSNFDMDSFLAAASVLEVDVCRNLCKMSFGQRKKSMLAFAFSLGVKHLLLDEPTNGLDINSRRALRQLISEYASGDRIVVVSTHQVGDIDGVVDSISILDNGKMLFNGHVYPLDTGTGMGVKTDLEELFLSFTKDKSKFPLL